MLVNLSVFLITFYYTVCTYASTQYILHHHTRTHLTLHITTLHTYTVRTVTPNNLNHNYFIIHTNLVTIRSLNIHNITSSFQIKYISLVLISPINLITLSQSFYFSTFILTRYCYILITYVSIIINHNKHELTDEHPHSHLFNLCTYAPTTTIHSLNSHKQTLLPGCYVLIIISINISTNTLVVYCITQ